MATVTRDQVVAAFDAVTALGEMIKALESVPNGELYARVMSTGINLATYNVMIDTLKRAGVVKESAHLLTWVGPK